MYRPLSEIVQETTNPTWTFYTLGFGNYYLESSEVIIQFIKIFSCGEEENGQSASLI